MENNELLEAIRGIVKEEVEPIKETLEELNVKVEQIGKKIDMTYDEVVAIREDMTKMDGSINKVKATQRILEDVTAHNWNEIRGIKKQVQ